MTFNPLEIEIPAWGDVFENDSIHPDNLAVINDAQLARRLTKRELRILKARRAACIETLEQGGYYQRKAQYERIRDEHQALKLELHDAQPEQRNRIRSQRRRLYRRAQRLAIEMEPYKRAAAYAWYLDRRESEHRAALDFEKKARSDRQDMVKEVQYFADKIQARYSQLKFREDVHKDGQHIVYRVKFEQCFVTEDEIIFKIDVSRVSVLGSSKSRLPDGVRVRDLVKPETLDELSAACERPIWSPHNPPDRGGVNLGFESGAWIVLSRLEMRHSVPHYIQLKHLLRKYRQADSHRFPLPFGVMRGRKINWGYISNESPHFMINGLTGSGKTNCIVGCVTTLVQMNSPDEIRLIMTDLKRGGDFRPFRNVPHNLVDDIIFTPKELRAVLERIAALLYVRQDQIGEIANDIGQYNKLVEPDQQLPRVLIVIDEYSETKDFLDKEVKQSIDFYVNTVARLGRAAGIHLMIGNQQPYQINIPSEVKGNITYHLTGYQMTLGASQSTVGNSSATKIEKIPGRMICNTGRDIFEVQQAHVTQDDVNQAIEAAKHWPAPRPFDWPDDDQVTTIIEDNQPRPFDHETLAAIAIEQFDGVMSQHKIHQVANPKHHVSRPNISRMIKDIARQGVIEVDGVDYVVLPYRSGFQLVQDATMQEYSQ